VTVLWELTVVQENIWLFEHLKQAFRLIGLLQVEVLPIQKFYSNFQSCEDKVEIVDRRTSQRSGMMGQGLHN